MYNFNEKRDSLSKILSEQYSQNNINLEEYERLLEYLNKIETNKEFSIIEKIIAENSLGYDFAINENLIPATKERNLSLFSWRTNNLKSINGFGGKYISIFGATRIIVNDLPKGRTVLYVKSVFGLTEIITPKNIIIINKTEPLFSGTFSPSEVKPNKNELPELYIIGKAIFGNITVETKNE